MKREELPIPFNESDWGELSTWSSPAPGVYEVITHLEDGIYVVDRSCRKCEIPKGIDRYGVRDGHLTYFDYDNGRFILQYELLLYQLNHNAGEQREKILRELVETSIYGAECYPKYFGKWTPQHVTPWGRLTRYLKVSPGLWFVQAGGVWSLCLGHVLYESIISDYLKKFAKGNRGVPPDGLLYEDMYFHLEDCAPAIHELLEQGCNRLEHFITSTDDLCACLCDLFPAYVRMKNENADSQITRKEGASIHFLKLPF